MKIIHVAQFLGIGGLEKIVYHLALEQQALGHDVSIYIYDHERTWVEFFRNSGLKVETPVLKKSGYDLSLLMRMNRDLSNAHIIHTHDLNPLMYLAPLSFARKLIFRKKFKLIHTTHGLDHIKNYPKALLYEKIVTRFADNIIGVSDKIAQFYKEEIKLKSKKISFIPNGISTYKNNISEALRREKKEWICKKHNLDINRPIILSLSRVTPLKDQKFLIHNLKLRNDFQLIVAGPPSDPDYYKELKNEETKNIKLIGAQELVSDYNLGSDLYVSASTHEGIPVAVLEAMAVETPCLVSDIPGHNTLNAHGTYVPLFSLNNNKDFLEKLDQMIINKEQSSARAQKARKIVEDYFSVTKMVSSYFEVYKS